MFERLDWKGYAFIERLDGARARVEAADKANEGRGDISLPELGMEALLANVHQMLESGLAMADEHGWVFVEDAIVRVEQALERLATTRKKRPLRKKGPSWEARD